MNPTMQAALNTAALWGAPAVIAWLSILGHYQTRSRLQAAQHGTLNRSQVSNSYYLQLIAPVMAVFIWFIPTIAGTMTDVSIIDTSTPAAHPHHNLGSPTDAINPTWAVLAASVGVIWTVTLLYGVAAERRLLRLRRLIVSSASQGHQL